MFWPQILGHVMQKELLSHALMSRRVHHAYLFFGPSGVGKKTLALEVAKALLCSESPDAGCGRCRSCLLFDASLHPDFFLISPKTGTIGIDEVRDLIERLALKRVLSPFRIGLIDEAEKLTEEAANCLLKTVEEPPEGVVLFLVTSQVLALPGTLVSRCQKLAFSALPEELVARYLEEHEGLSPDLARALAFASSGSIGEALRLARGMEDTLFAVRSFLETVQEGDIFRAGFWLSQHREELHRILPLLAGYLRDALFVRLLGDRYHRATVLSREDRCLVERLAHLDSGALRRALVALGTFSEDILSNAQWDVACFHFLLKLRGELS
jgi:DNA polymerase-3 subunit delta'